VGEKEKQAAGILRRAIVLGLALGAGALMAPSGAVALAPHAFLGDFCESTGLGTAPCEPSFAIPEGMAIDQSTHDLLVINRESGTVSRYHQNGTSADFSALGTNVIDGEGSGPPCTPPSIECDGTPQGHLAFGGPGEVQVAADNSGGVTDGDIYVPQAITHVVDIFASSGEYLGQLTESSEGPFAGNPPITNPTEPCGVAVDPSGNVYVGDFSGHIHKYEPAANPPVNGDNSANFEFAENCTLAAGAGASAGSLFAVHFEGAVAKLDAASGEEKYPVRAGNNTTAAVDPASGHVFVASGSEVFEFEASGPSEAKLFSRIEAGGEKAAGVAVDEASGDVYVAHNVTPNLEVWGPAVVLPQPVTEEASAVGAAGARLNGSVNPEGLALTECKFEWGVTQSYGHTAACEEPDATGVGTGGTPVPVHADISGLEAGTTYHFRLVATNASGSEAGEDETLRTLGASIEEEAASLVTQTSARLGAKVNPNGEAASYAFEYLSEAQFEEGGGYAEATSLPSPPGEAGSGSEFLAVSQQLSGLAPDTTYHFRIAVTTGAATHLGEDKTFTTFAPGPPGPPDGRGYELVSPAQKIGEVFPPEPTGLWSGTCGNCLPGINVAKMPMQARSDGEAVAYEGYPFAENQAPGQDEYISRRGSGGWSTEDLSTPLYSSMESQGFKALSADLGRAVVYQTEPTLSPLAPVGGEGQSYANLYLRDANGTLTPLVDEMPPQRVTGHQSLERFKIGFAGANAGTALSPALSHVIFEANDALTEDAPAVEADERNLYEWEGGQLRLVNLAPGNAEAIAGATFGSGRELTNEVAASGADFDGAISADGSRVFFSARASGQVYVRIDGAETEKVKDSGKFLVASPDGSRVLLSDGCLYSVEDEGCEADLSEGQSGFQGILGAAADLSRVYFVDTAALPGAGQDQQGEEAQAGEDNLYAWDEEGTTAFIGALRPGDNELSGVQPQVGDWMPSASSRTAQVSADGRFLAFMSRAPLTGFDNAGRDNACGANSARCFEVFEYRAGDEKLVCASCNPSGQRPLGGSNLSLIFRGVNSIALSGFRQPGNLTADDGRLFFESQDALTPADVNGRIQDVYEWEPEGVGSCGRPSGCVSLISSGQSPNDSMFLDATPSGDDAFLVTRERLLPQDEDEKLDLYDARVGGGFPPPPTPPCGGQPCRGPSSTPPALQGPASGGFSGPGNLKPSHKHKRHHHKHHKRHRAKGGSR
jgi:hypothetical protein